MKDIYFRIITTLLLTVVTTGCSIFDFLEKDDDKDTNYEEIPELTEENASEVITAIGNQLNNFLIDNDIKCASDAIPYVEELKKKIWVENAQIEDDAIIIKVKNGGKIIIAEPTLIDDIDETDETRSIKDSEFSQLTKELQKHIISTTTKYAQIKAYNEADKSSISFLTNRAKNLTTEIETISDREQLNPISSYSQKANQNGFRNCHDLLYGCNNKKVLIANVTDSEIKSMQEILNKVNDLLSNYYGVFEVEYKKNREVTVDFLENHLTDYGLIILVAHGMKVNEKFYLFTGSGLDDHNWLDFEKWDNGDEVLVKRFIPDSRLVKDYFMVVSPDFFKKINGTFTDNSIMLTISCGCMKNKDDNMGKNLLDKGLGTFIGYDDIVRSTWAEDAINSILRLLITPLYSSDNSEDYSELSIEESFKIYDKSPYSGIYEGRQFNCTCIKLQQRENLALFSTISTADTVNLGLPTIFASCNLGANSPEEKGSYYEIFKQDKYLLDGFISGTSYDVVRKQANQKKWHLPTYLDYVFIPVDGIQYNFKYKGVTGIRITGISGESIFVPYAGVMVNDEKLWDDILACYPCGNLSFTVDYATSQYWWEQIQEVLSMNVSKEIIYNNLNERLDDIKVDNIGLSYIGNTYGYNVSINQSDLTITIHKSDGGLNDAYKYVIRPVYRNNWNGFNEIWKTFDDTTDKSLDKTKLITLDDIKKAAAKHYPNYKIVVD